MKRLKVLLVFSLCVCVALGSVACNKNTAGSGPVTPKLVVVIVVDQFRYDYVERFRDVFGPDGFRRLIDKGALFTNANYIYVPTFTAPGHAAIFTGSVPAQNGIVGNNWFDRNATDGTPANKVMVADDTAKLVTSWGQQTNTKATKPASPRVLIGTTFGDQMRLATGFKSKVVAISFKDRAAVLPGGKEANGAYWFDASSGTMVSTDYYFQDMPKWVNKFNSEDRANKYYDLTWDKALGPEAYSTTQAVTTDVAGTPLERSFPHVLKNGVAKGSEDYYRAFQYTPFASEYLADFAKAAIEGESLGSDKYPDLLAISFSTPDLVGHSYGPDSEEIEDTYIRLDRTLAEFLNYLDSKVGLSNVLIAMTGDHGVAPVPRFMAIHNVEAVTLDPAKFIDAARTALSNKYGKDEQCDTDTDPKRGKCWVQALVNNQLYLNQTMMADKKADPAEAEHIAGEAAMIVPGLMRYFTRSQIMEGRMPPGALSQRLTNGFNPVRSGDVWLITKPFDFLLGEGSIATTHGGPYNYDTHVPVILFGTGIRPGRYYSECSPSDIAPTISAMLGIEPPSGRVGRVLSEAINTE